MHKPLIRISAFEKESNLIFLNSKIQIYSELTAMTSLAASSYCSKAVSKRIDIFFTIYRYVVIKVGRVPAAFISLADTQGQSIKTGWATRQILTDFRFTPWLSAPPYGDDVTLVLLTYSVRTCLIVLVLVEDGRRVHDELTVPHSLSNLFLNVFTVSAITTCSGRLFQC